MNPVKNELYMKNEMYSRVSANLEVSSHLRECAEKAVLPGLGHTVTPEKFWGALETLLDTFYERNLQLLKKRDVLQEEIDKCPDVVPSKAFLEKIGYLVPDQGPLRMETNNVDPEIGQISAPQLVVPLDNARYALNAANARWGSLFDALYGTDAMGSKAPGGGYNAERGLQVFQQSFAHLDQFLPLAKGAKWSSVAGVEVQHGVSGSERKDDAVFKVGAEHVLLQNPGQFVGSRTDAKGAGGILELFFKHNDLHIVLVIDPSTQSGKQSAFGLSDVLLEAAITAIMDCEDSVSVIDAEDKSRVYAHWSAMMKGELEFKMPNGSVRKMNADKVYRSALDGCEGRISGTGCLFIRNVGIHMFSHAALYKSQPVPEGLLDLLFTGVGGLHDCLGRYNNSKKGSIYIVKPKMHGPEEAAFVVQTFDRLEELLKFPKNTIKLGIMDEERRTSANLKEVLRVANGRVCFINTGFLDRTGDEIHTSFKKKPMMCKDTIKSSVFIPVYERRNVEIGLATCTHENAQIGKGMWAEPDAMANMLKTKIGHPKAGANTAWVPSPTAATLHALHYHQCSVKEVQREVALKVASFPQNYDFEIEQLLQPPYLEQKLTPAEMEQELKNNVQGLLGYVVRWVQLGVGCSAIPNIHGVGLMEDRATLRISSQHIANWLYHKLITKEQVLKTFEEMCAFVNEQNRGVEGYTVLNPKDEECYSYKAAIDLVFEGEFTKNGYTEDILHRYRLLEKLKHKRPQSKL